MAESQRNVLGNHSEHAVGSEKDRIEIQRALRNMGIRDRHRHALLRQLAAQIADAYPMLEGRIVNGRILQQFADGLTLWLSRRTTDQLRDDPIQADVSTTTPATGLPCPRCGGRLRVLATVQDPRAVQAILAYRARSGAPAPPGPAPPAPAALT